MRQGNDITVALTAKCRGLFHHDDARSEPRMESPWTVRSQDDQLKAALSNSAQRYNASPQIVCNRRYHDQYLCIGGLLMIIRAPVMLWFSVEAATSSKLRFRNNVMLRCRNLAYNLRFPWQGA
jgi:hypothetical protein